MRQLFPLCNLSGVRANLGSGRFILLTALSLVMSCSSQHKSGRGNLIGKSSSLSNPTAEGGGAHGQTQRVVSTADAEIGAEPALGVDLLVLEIRGESLHIGLTAQASACLQLKNSDGTLIRLSDATGPCRTLIDGYSPDISVKIADLNGSLSVGESYKVCNYSTDGNHGCTAALVLAQAADPVSDPVTSSIPTPTPTPTAAPTVVTDNQAPQFPPTPPLGVDLLALELNGGSLHISLSAQASACLQIKTSSGSFIRLNTVGPEGCGTLIFGYTPHILLPLENLTGAMSKGSWYEVCNYSTDGNHGCSAPKILN